MTAASKASSYRDIHGPTLSSYLDDLTWVKLPTLDKAGEEKSVWTTAGDYVAVVTGFGNSVSQSTKRAYKTMENLHIANLIVRDDVGEGLKEQLPKLHKMGYALHCNY